MYKLLAQEQPGADGRSNSHRTIDTSSSSSSVVQKRTGSVRTVEDEEHSSPTVEFLETEPGSSESDSLRNRRFVSSHRRLLDFIKKDAVESRRHAVPHNHFDRQCDQGYLRGVIPNLLSPDGNNRSASEWIESFLPIWSWIKMYDFRSNLITDLVAGLTVGVMIIPQSMSYARLAGLPVECGLYSALFPIYAYAVFGSSRQLAVGPVAIISLILSSGLPDILEGYANLEPGTPEYQAQYNQTAVQISFLVGITYIGMGICRMGFLTIFLSKAVISGFTTGAAIIISMSQVKFILGYDVERSDRFYALIRNTLANIENFNWRTFLLGSASIGFLMFAKTASRQSPKYHWLRAAGPLAVTAFSIVLTAAFSLQDKGIPVVGRIPSGLPPLTVSYWTPVEGLNKLLAITSSITIVGFMESIAIAKQLASRHKYEIDSSKELIGLGMANFVGGMFGSYPVTGSFSRSAVNNESGAQSGISGIVTATLVGLVLLFLTKIFEKMPLCILASIVISGVISLLDYEEAIYLWAVHRFDFSVWMVACFGTLFLGVETGLAIAVGVSLLIVLYESAYPHTAVLGRLPGTNIYRNVRQYPDAERYDGVVLVRIDGSLHFANAQNVRDKIRKYRLQAEVELEANVPEGLGIKYLVLDFSPVSTIDTSALHILEDMYENYTSRGQQIILSNPSLDVMQRLMSCGLADKIGREHIFASAHDAVNWCLHEMDCEATTSRGLNETEDDSPGEMDELLN